MDLSHLTVKEGQKLDLKATATSYDGLSEKEALERLKKNNKKLQDFQERLFAQKKYSVLCVFQAMDAAGKDSTIKNVFGPVNPQGCNVYSFKAPTELERAHDFLWRCNAVTPPQGMIHVFNRSHYEEVLVTRVHPGYILGQKIPGVESESDVNNVFWESRFERIRDFEANLAAKGTIVIKFFLNVGKDEQLDRFHRRLDRPDKRWKFNIGDVKERLLWKDYMKAYEEMLSATSTDVAPWHIIPADSKPVMRALVSEIVKDTLKDLPIDFPDFDGDVEGLHAEMKEHLNGENS